MRRKLVVLLLSCAVVFGTAAPSAASMSLPGPEFNAPAEGFGSVASFACWPSLRDGTKAFADLIRASSGYPYGGWRPCDATYGVAKSDHKSGRAVDVFIDYRAGGGQADGRVLLDWLFVSGAERLRRLGVVEIIWAGSIWRSQTDSGNLSSNPSNWRPYTGLGCLGPTDSRPAMATSCHFDHIHFTLSAEGSEKRTTWWTAPSANGKYLYTINSGKVFEAASNNAWRNNQPDIKASAVGVTTITTTNYLYTLNGGVVFEAASNNGWRNIPPGMTGSALAVTSMGNVNYVYTLSNGHVFEAATNNGWQNLPTGINGSALAVMSMNGVKYIYTLINGQVYEANSDNRWQNIPTGISGSALAVMSMNGVKYIYTLVNGQVYEANSENGWRSLPSGISGSALAVMSLRGVKYVYTLVNGQVYEANSDNSWRSLPTGVSGSTLAITKIDE